jgi:hypothetical protein
MQERVSLVGKYSNYLHELAKDYGITFSDMVNELCEWAVSDSEGKGEFEAYLDEEYPEDEESGEASEEEEEEEEEPESEA